MNNTLLNIRSKTSELEYSLREFKKDVANEKVSVTAIVYIRDAYRTLFGKQHRLENRTTPTLGNTLEYISTLKLDNYTERLLSTLIEIYNGYNPELLITMENHVRYPDYKLDKSNLKVRKIPTVNVIRRGWFHMDSEYISLSQMYTTYNLITMLQLLSIVLRRITN